ncbi:MAG: heavy metal-associated domain-containing protein [Bacteroidota bacterium]
MKTEKILVANLTCGLCENTIQHSMSEIEGVQSIIINHEEESITIKHSGLATTDDFTVKLHSIGYRDYSIL